MGGPPERSAPLPAFIAEADLHKALLARPADVAKLQQFGLVAAAFLLCARPSTARELQSGDIELHASHIN